MKFNSRWRKGNGKTPRYGRRRERRWTPTRDTRASPNCLETHLVRKWGTLDTYVRWAYGAMDGWMSGWMSLLNVHTGQNHDPRNEYSLGIFFALAKAFDAVNNGTLCCANWTDRPTWFRRAWHIPKIWFNCYL